MVLIGLITFLVAACGGAGSGSPVTPAVDKLTFLFFYTDNWIPWQNMQPIVDGFENEYIDQFEFRSLDANVGEGKQAFQAYNIPGHPSYVILNATGEVLWLGVGEQPGDQIMFQLDAALSK